MNYNIDFYQRDYAWERRHVQELIDDLAGRFLASYDPRHEHAEVGEEQARLGVYNEGVESCQ